MVARNQRKHVTLTFLGKPSLFAYKLVNIDINNTSRHHGLTYGRNLENSICCVSNTREIIYLVGTLWKGELYLDFFHVVTINILQAQQIHSNYNASCRMKTSNNCVIQYHI